MQAVATGNHVPGVGFEPTRPFGQWCLRPSRLPFRQPGRVAGKPYPTSLADVTQPVDTNPATEDVRRVVIAEDEALIRMDLAEMLGEEGYQVVGQAGDGQKAIELARELRPDLVILDVKMPVLDGIAAAEAIASERIAPVVILTAFSQRDLVARARDAGAMAYLVKPFQRGDLVPAIEMAVSRYAEITVLEREVSDLQESLATRKSVDRAKGVLQEKLGLSEPDAFRWIQKTAMDLRLSMKQVADGVVEHGVP
jgi:AmiR/NasT family two-component response regulator